MKESPPRHRRAGFSLVEVTLALGIVAFCIVPIVGLLGVGYNANQASMRQTSAATIASAISTDLRATPRTATSSPYFNLPIPPSGTTTTNNLYVQDDGVTLTAPSASHPTFLATVVLTSAVSGTLGAGSARIFITWPALANQPAGVVPTQFSGSLETLVGLDPN